MYKDMYGEYGYRIHERKRIMSKGIHDLPALRTLQGRLRGRHPRLSHRRLLISFWPSFLSSRFSYSAELLSPLSSLLLLLWRPSLAFSDSNLGSSSFCATYPTCSARHPLSGFNGIIIAIEFSIYRARVTLRSIDEQSIYNPRSLGYVEITTRQY